MNLLKGAPWLLAHRSMLAVNQPTKVSLYDKDYVLWRDRQGNITALPNACPHMGAMLSEGWCVEANSGESSVVCPFHALEFDLRGCTILPGKSTKTLPLLKPLELIIQGDFIWTYGDEEPEIPIPAALNEIAKTYEFIGSTADVTVETDLLTMLLNMHDYNHQNGTHRDLFRIKSVNFQQFIDQGHHSEAFFETPTAKATFKEILKNPGVLMLPEVIKAHLENHFPSLVIFHGDLPAGRVAQCHLFVPEASGRTRTYILLFGQPKHPMFKLMKNTFLGFAKTVVEQDAGILGKLYPETTPQIKLNNEVGMDWVKRNFKNWPAIAKPNLSK